MPENPIHLTLTGRLSFEDDITIGEATQIIAFIDAARGGGTSEDSLHAPLLLNSDVRAASEQSVRHRTVSNPREALDVTGAKNNAEKIVALAAYVLQDGELDTFTLDTIRPLFRRAREATPGNLNRDLDTAVTAGWIADGDNKGELYLTARVENVLEIGFEAIRSKRTASTVRPRTNGTKKPRATKTPEAFEGVDIFAVPMQGMPPYGSLKLKRDKLLWGAKLAKEMSMTGLDNKQVVWLTDKLGDGIPANDINGHFRGLQKPGYVNRSTIDNVIRITESGEAYLKSLVVASE
jgi:hypothetical protein